MEEEIKIDVNGKSWAANIVNNSSGKGFINLLKKGPLKINMSDYGNFEKVGDLPENIPTNDKNYKTKPGDIILYLGKHITIYYNTNTWNFTKLGEIENVTQAELKQVLGKGDCEVTFSIKNKFIIS